MALRLIVVALLVIGSGSVFADEFTIANTGFLADGTTLGTPGTSTDGNWAFIACPATSLCGGASVGSPVAPYVTNDGGYPFVGAPGDPVWMADDSTSQWISPRASYRDYLAGDPGSPDGVYSYRVEFDLTGLLPGTANLTFRVAADNIVSDVLINGVSTGWAAAGSFDYWTAGAVGSGFIAGINTLDFVVSNWNAPYDHDGDPSTPDILVATPSGLRVEFLSATADPVVVIPEPATMGLMGFGLLALGVAFRRRSRQG